MKNRALVSEQLVPLFLKTRVRMSVWAIFLEIIRFKLDKNESLLDKEEILQDQLKVAAILTAIFGSA